MRWNVSLLIISLLPAQAYAAAEPLTPAQAHAVVSAELKLVARYYVFPEKRAAIVAAIRAKEAARAYDIGNASELAERLGADVIAAAHDKHMWITYDPKQYAGLLVPPAEAHDAGDDRGRIERDNYGYREMKILPGNVRYVKLTTFNWQSEKVPLPVTDAARFLGGGDAVVVDLRDNGGGSGEAVRDLVSYFMPAKRQELMAYHDGITGTTAHTYVDVKLAAPRMVGKPLYVLTSGATGSAAEEFAYHVKMFKLGTLVGETTAGAANNDSLYPIPPGFVASISTGRAIHPVNRSNWEGEGVAPDVAVTADKALDQAELLALDRLSRRPGANAQDYQWAITGLKARLAPPQLDAIALTAYAGVYGVRTITLEKGGLIFQRAGRSPKPMTALAADLFTLGDTDDTRLIFHRSEGRVTGFDMVTEDGQSIAVARTG
jgi:hypothetical protein